MPILAEDHYIVELAQLDPGSRKNIFREVSILLDDIGNSLLDEDFWTVQMVDGEYTHNSTFALARLYDFENMGIYKSRFQPKDDGTQRVWDITKFGRQLRVDMGIKDPSTLEVESEK